MANDYTTKMKNKVVIDGLFSDDSENVKEAQQTVNSFLRTKAEEEGIWRAVLPPINITAADLDRQYGIEEPVKIEDKEPNSAKAVTVPFGSKAESREFEGDEYLVVFNKIETVEWRKSKYDLLNYTQDIREMITDKDLYRILEKEDKRAFNTVDYYLGGQDTELSYAGDVALWQSISGGVTSETWTEALQIMVQSSSRFQPKTIVMNAYTAFILESWSSFDIGESMKEEITANGFTEGTFRGKKILITIKDDVVPNNTFYLFAEPDTLGKFYVLDDVTMYTDAEKDMLEWSSQECVGMSLGQITGCARADFS